MTPPAGTLHLVRDRALLDDLVGELVRREAAAGRQPTVVLLHDAAAAAAAEVEASVCGRAQGAAVRVLTAGEDRRRRGLPCGGDAVVDADGIVELVTSSPRVICW